MTYYLLWWVVEAGEKCCGGCSPDSAAIDLGVSTALFFFLRSQNVLTNAKEYSGVQVSYSGVQVSYSGVQVS